MDHLENHLQASTQAEPMTILTKSGANKQLSPEKERDQHPAGTPAPPDIAPSYDDPLDDPNGIEIDGIASKYGHSDILHNRISCGRFSLCM